MKEILALHRQKYPEMEVQDAIKLMFQSEYGPGHLIADKTKAKEFLLKEMKETQNDKVEIVPVSEHLVRFHLGKMPEEAADDVLSAMIQSAESVSGSQAGLEKKLMLLCEENGFEGAGKIVKAYLEKGEFLISHSEIYRALYHPHYRVLLKEEAEKLYQKYAEKGESMKETVRIESLNKKYEIVSVVTRPDTEEKVPAVILCHGTGSDKHEVGNLYVHLADALANAGIASVRFDFIGNGESTEDYRNYTLTSAQEDVKAVKQYIIHHPHLDETKIGIVGFSQGGSVALLSACAQADIQCLVAWSAALSLGGLVSEAMRKEAEAQGWAWLNFDFRESVRLSKTWMDEADQMDILSQMKQRSFPVLAIAGRQDEVVPCKCAEKIVASSNHTDSEVMLVDTDHIFNVLDNDEIWPSVIEKTVSWLKGNFTWK